MYEPPGDRCRQMEEVLSLGKRLYLLSQAEFVRVVTQELKRSKNAESYNYLAVLTAVLSKDKRLRAPLSSVARTEELQQIRYKYAAAAVARLSLGKCPEAILKEPNFTEICTFEDPDFNRLSHYAE